MEDPRTLAVLQMTVALITSANPIYATRTIAEVSSELLGSSQGIDHVFGIDLPPEPEGTVQ